VPAGLRFKVAIGKGQDEAVREVIGDSAGGKWAAGGVGFWAMQGALDLYLYPSVACLLGRPIP